MLSRPLDNFLKTQDDSLLEQSTPNSLYFNFDTKQFSRERKIRPPPPPHRTQINKQINKELSIKTGI